MPVTVIIPTYKNTAFIDECLNSVCASLDGIEGEVLVGIDCCEETRSHVESGKHDGRIRFFFFEKNVGPYVIKNTLAGIAKHEDIVFFDSDDVMKPEMLADMLEKMQDFRMVRPMFINFNDGDDYSSIDRTTSAHFAEGVFGIKKELFLGMNGFEPWKCAADTEFKMRSGKNGVLTGRTARISFFRRKHGTSLTKNKETNFFSATRKQYAKMISSKSDHGPLPELATEKYTEIKAL